MMVIRRFMVEYPGDKMAMAVAGVCSCNGIRRYPIGRRSKHFGSAQCGAPATANKDYISAH